MTIWSVLTRHGHDFGGTDDESRDSCLTCGALYALVPDPDDPQCGHYTTADGSQPDTCSRDTSRAHGDFPERYCDEHFPEPCPHTTHSCNCLLCA